MRYLRCFSIILSVLCTVSFVQAADQTAGQKKLDEKFDIMLDDEYEDDTDALAIPLDDSNEEDEEDLQMMEKKSAEFQKK